MYLLSRFIVNCIAVATGVLLLPGIHMENSFGSILGVTLVISILNTFLKPFLILITIPITIFTLGIFLLVINALMIMLAGNLLDNFSVDGFWWALLFSFILSIVNSLFRERSDQPKRVD